MSSNDTTYVTVAGATGNLALRIIERLLVVPNIYVRGFARSPEKIPNPIRNHERFTVIQGQVHDTAKIHEAVQGATVVICAYQGYEDVMLHGQIALIDACETLGVPRYIASDWTLDYNRLELGQHEGKDCMIKVKDYLKHKKVKGVHILIGCFMETWFGYMQVWDPDTTTFPHWGSGDEPWEVTTFDDAASYTVAIVQDPSAEGTFRFCGDKKSSREVAQIYERVYGIKPTLKERGNLDQLYDLMHAEKQKYIGQNKWLYMTLFYQYYILNGQTLFDKPIDNGRYPYIKPDDFESFLRKNNVADTAHRIKPI